MPYAIHERGFEYNDEYFELHNALSLHQTYLDKAEAVKAWVGLEKDRLSEVPLMQRAPLVSMIMMSEEDAQIYQTLLDKLLEYGIYLDETIKEEVLQGYADNEQLQLKQLNDEQLLAVLQETTTNVYCILEFNSSAEHSRYVLQFYHPELSEMNVSFNGYLPNIYYDCSYEVCSAAHPDELFDSEVFNDINASAPMITAYQLIDEQNPLVKSLLAQYADCFKVIDRVIDSESPSELHSVLHYLGGNTPALRALNEVLSNPYFRVHALSYEELVQLQQDQKRDFIPYQENDLQPAKPKKIAIANESMTNKLTLWQKVMSYFGK